MADHFADRLCKAVRAKKTPLVVGLDPVYSRLPADITTHPGISDQYDTRAALDAIFDFCAQVMRIVAPIVPAVKLNTAFFEKYLWEGVESYYALIAEANELGIETIGDVKRGDVGHTAKMYAAAHLENQQLKELGDTLAADAITINGFSGVDGIEPFARVATEQGKGVFVWVRSSNPSAAVLQDFADAAGEKMYEKIAAIVAELAGKNGRTGEEGYSNIGMIIGGTSPEVGAALRKKYQNIWFLVPGYGSQGAGAQGCIRFCRTDGTGALINASRSIIYAYEKPKYKHQCGNNWKKCIEQAVIDAKVDLAQAMQSML